MNLGKFTDYTLQVISLAIFFVSFSIYPSPPYTPLEVQKHIHLCVWTRIIILINHTFQSTIIKTAPNPFNLKCFCIHTNMKKIWHAVIVIWIWCSQKVTKDSHTDNFKISNTFSNCLTNFHLTNQCIKQNALHMKELLEVGDYRVQSWTWAFHLSVFALLWMVSMLQLKSYQCGLETAIKYIFFMQW